MNDIEVIKSNNITIDKINNEINYRQNNFITGMCCCNDSELLGYSLTELKNIRDSWRREVEYLL